VSADDSPRTQRNVTVVVVSFNGAAYLQGLVSTALTSPSVREVIVVDNASEDSSLRIAREAGARTIALEENRGYGAGCNLGLRLCTTDYIAFCNQDLELRSEAFDVLADAAMRLREERGADVIAGPGLRTPEGVMSESGHRLPSWRRQALALICGSRLLRLRDVLALRPTSEQFCDWLSAACVVGPTSAVRAIGGFDESYFMYVEDVDFFERWRRAGGLVAWVSSESVVHRGGRRPVSASLQAWAITNWARYFRRTTGAGPAWVIFLAAVVGSAGRGLFWSTVRRRSPESSAYTKMFLGGAGRAVRRQVRDAYHRHLPGSV
jgi:N-acetylglucosaminyl-diphospho-decaprenol L-rhamnosyltransferase